MVISTIQRLFSLLKGEDITDGDDDENYDVDAVADIALPANLTLPPDYFDMIIIDECHRSIYGSWRKVLDYFNTAKMVGLTATPAPETLAFFNNNRIVNYTLEKSIADGVNVDYRVYRIKTQATEDGGAIREGEKVKKITGSRSAVVKRSARLASQNRFSKSMYFITASPSLISACGGHCAVYPR